MVLTESVFCTNKARIVGDPQPCRRCSVAHRPTGFHFSAAETRSAPEAVHVQAVSVNGDRLFCLEFVISDTGRLC